MPQVPCPASSEIAVTAGELVEESVDGVWSLYVGSVLLGKIDEATMKVCG